MGRNLLLAFRTEQVKPSKSCIIMNKALALFALSVATVGAAAQDKGRVETYDFDSFKLHVYYTNDVMGDASYVVEGRDSLVTMEQPLFKDNIAEFDAYVAGLGKPVAQRIADYHVGGTGDKDIVMAEGMPAFAKGPVYGGMMNGFAQAFGDAITALPTGKTSEVAFGETTTWAGVNFTFRHGAASDFPGASIVVGGKAYYTHWTPAKAHVSHLQISSAAAIDAEIAESENALKSGAEIFIGGHGGAAKVDAVKFKIGYLKTLKKQLKKSKTQESFIAAMKKAYPNLPGEEGLGELAKALYK